MHIQFLEFLCCPETGQELDLVIEKTYPGNPERILQGRLVVRNRDRFYPITNGIPRFVSQEKYAASFGFEWNRWPRIQFEAQNTGRPMEGYTTRMWKRITRTCTKDIVKKTFVEFGCGPGRFLDVIRSRGGRAVGLELTQAADAARENFAADPDVLIVQADIFHPPFKPGVFDGGYSIGVLHHTPDPPKGLMELAKTIRSGGWTAISVYSKEGLYGFRSVENFRRLHLWLKPILGYRFALAYSYFSAYLLAPLLNMARTLPHLGLRRFIDFLLQNWIVALAGLPDRHWRLLDTFDAITPAIATAHTGEEVRQWMQAAGFIEISPTEWGDTSFKGVKP